MKHTLIGVAYAAGIALVVLILVQNFLPGGVDKLKFRAAA